MGGREVHESDAAEWREVERRTAGLLRVLASAIEAGDIHLASIFAEPGAPGGFSPFSEARIRLHVLAAGAPFGGDILAALVGDDEQEADHA